MTVVMEDWLTRLTLVTPRSLRRSESSNLWWCGVVWCGTKDCTDYWDVIRSPGFLLYSFPVELKLLRREGRDEYVICILYTWEIILLNK